MSGWYYNLADAKALLGFRWSLIKKGPSLIKSYIFWRFLISIGVICKIAIKICREHVVTDETARENYGKYNIIWIRYEKYSLNFEIQKPQEEIR